MYLFQFSTCFEQPCAHHQENQLYQYNVWYMSLCVGDRLVCRSERKFFSMYLFQFSTCFDNTMLIIRRINCINTSGICHCVGDVSCAGRRPAHETVTDTLTSQTTSSGARVINTSYVQCISMSDPWFFRHNEAKRSEYTRTITLRTHVSLVFNMESEIGNYIYPTNGEIKFMLL